MGYVYKPIVPWRLPGYPRKKHKSSIHTNENDVKNTTDLTTYNLTQRLVTTEENETPTRQTSSVKNGIFADANVPPLRALSWRKPGATYEQRNEQRANILKKHTNTNIRHQIGTWGRSPYFFSQTSL